MADDIMDLHGGESRADPLIRNNPFPFYRALREQDPVYYDPKLDLYLVTRYDDVQAVLADPITYSLEHGFNDRWGGEFADQLIEILKRDGGGYFPDSALSCDPPAHTRIRRLIEQAFTAHRVKTLEPRIRKIVADLIEPLAAKGRGDGLRDIGVPLTARIICEQLGFDYSEVGTERITRWTTAVLAQIGRMQTYEQMLENAREMCDLQNYIIPRIREREQEPREDMVSDLVHAHLDDEQNPRLLFEEQVTLIKALLIAGNDTTAAAIANLMMILATQPDVARAIYNASDDDRLLSRYVEEILRLEPPVHGLFRTAIKEVELGGKVIPAYSQLCVLFASGNDDENHFSCPRTLDLNRTNIGNHLTFGKGIHRCVGSALARMEIKVALQEIIKRLDNIQLDMPVEEITYLPTMATQTLERLPLTFSRRI